MNGQKYKPITNSLRNIDDLKLTRKLCYIAVPIASVLLFIFSVQIIWLAIILFVIPQIIGYLVIAYITRRINYNLRKIQKD